VDSANAHFEALQTAIAAQGHHMSSAFYKTRTGLDRISILNEFDANTDRPFDIQLACQNGIEAFIDQSAAVSPIPETADLVRSLGKDIPMAVGTNSENELARATLTATGLIEFFDHISSVSDGLPAKPAPDIFRRSAERLGIPFERVLVFEDSDESVRAARDAKLDVIRLLHPTKT
jgi:HAD superfamily hydrolase (TIGR01509 family)